MALDKQIPLLGTGAGGVLGRAVLAMLERAGFTNVFTPTSTELDLLDAKITMAWFEKYQPKAVICLASVVFGLAGNLKNQFRSVVENTTINTNFFAAIHKFPVERCFFAGTVASYPFPYRAMPLVEEQFFEGLPHYGEFGYAMAKRHAYSFLKILAKEYGLKATYGIFTNLYGTHDRFDVENGHVIPSLIAKAHQAFTDNKPLEIWGNGKALRDFLHADDAASAILLCLTQDTPPELINISSGQAVSIGQIAQIVADAAGVKELQFLIDKPVGIPERVVCNKKLLELGFSQKISIEDGLTATYEWYKNNQGKIRV